MKIKKGNKIKIIKLILYIIVFLFISYNIIFLLNTTITEKDYIKLFGITFLKMENELMENDICLNDLVVLKSVNEKKLQVGDIIAYTVNGQTRINKIINIKNGYTTKSNKNYYPDIEKIQIENIIGEKVLNIPSLGILLEIMQSKITSIFIFIFLTSGFITNMYKEKKREERAIKKKEFKKYRLLK